MSKIFLFKIMIILIGLTPCKAQGVINIVDSDRVMDNLHQKKNLDSIYLEVESRLHQIGRNWAEHFQYKYMKLIEGPLCHSSDQLDEMENRLKREHASIKEYERIVFDSLPVLKTEIRLELLGLIKEEIVKLSKDHDLGIVMERKNLVYYNEAEDISDLLIARLNTGGQELEENWKGKLRDIWFDLFHVKEIERMIIRHLTQRRAIMPPSD